MCFDSLMNRYEKSIWRNEAKLSMLYGFFMINSSSFCAFISVDKSDNDWWNYVNQLAMDGLPKCGLATVCFDAIPLQEVHITCVALNWRRMLLFKLSTFWGTLEPWYVCLDCFFSEKVRKKFPFPEWDSFFSFANALENLLITLW